MVGSRLLICFCALWTTLGSDILQMEIEHTEALVGDLEMKFQLLTRLRDDLLSRNESIPTAKDVAAYREMEDAAKHSNLHLLRHFNILGGTQVAGEIADLDIVSSYSGLRESILVALCHRSGYVQFLDVFGGLLGEVQTNSHVDYCAFSSQTDDFRFATVSNQVHSLSIFGLSALFNRSSVISLTSTVSVPLFAQNEPVSNLTSLVFFPRLSKKNWIATDSDGFIWNFHYNGTIIKRGETNLGAIIAVEKSAQQLIIATRKRLASYHVGGMEVSQTCEQIYGEIVGMAVEQGSPHVYISLSSGDLLVYDMKYAPGHGIPATCKALYRFPSVLKPSPWSISTVKGNLLAWSEGGFLTFVNTSVIDSEKPELPIRMQMVPELNAGKSLMDVFRYQNSSSLIVLLHSPFVTLLEAALPTIESPSGSFFDLNFGNFRVLALVGGILFFLVWNRKRSQQEREDEEISEQFQLYSGNRRKSALKGQ